MNVIAERTSMLFLPGWDLEPMQTQQRVSTH